MRTHSRTDDNSMSVAKDDPIAVRISRTLADRIISGEIDAGAKLRQDHIAEEFGTSHVPVREAFRRLESQGLVISQPRKGVRVAGFSLEEVREVDRERDEQREHRQPDGDHDDDGAAFGFR